MHYSDEQKANLLETLREILMHTKGEK
jgi:hypothetical protein